MIISIKSLSDARQYMEQMKKFEVLSFTSGEGEAFAVHCIKYIDGLFNVSYIHSDIKKDSNFKLNDDECVDFLYKNKEDINKSMFFKWGK